MSPALGDDGATVLIETPPPPEILISTVVPLIANVFPDPTKFNVLTGPDVIVVPAEEMPRLKPPDAVTIPVNLLSPKTSSFDMGIVVPIPTLSVFASTYRLEIDTKLAVYLVLSAIYLF
jgi:hypothetical protein